MARTGKFWRLARLRRLAVYLMALWKTLRHPATPRAAKWAALAVLAYIVSPIDLIPDVVPLAGQIDDLVMIPLGVTLVSRLVPAPQWQARLAEAERGAQRLPRMAWWLGLGALALALLGALGLWALLR